MVTRRDIDPFVSDRRPRQGIETKAISIDMSALRHGTHVHVKMYKDREKRANAPAVTDMTNYTHSVKIDYSMQRPWENASITFIIPGGVANVICPTSGDWITVSAPTLIKHDKQAHSTIFLGYVKEISKSANVSENGAVSSYNIVTTAVSWLEAHATNQVITALIANESIGTFFAGGGGNNTEGVDESGKKYAWTSVVDTVISAVRPEDPLALGKSARRLWKALGAIQLPAAMGEAGTTPTGRPIGFRCGNAIPLVFDKDTGQKYCPNVTMDPVPGWSVEGIKSMLPNGQSTVDMLLGSYQADFNMVEMFPTMEPLNNTKDAHPIAQHLNAQPVLVYRMKPIRAQELGQYFQNPRTVFGRSKAVKSYNKNIFQGVTWNLRDESGKIIHGASYPADLIANINMTQSDQDHINSVSINLPGQGDSAVQWLSQAGLPIQHRQDIISHGVRHFSPRWPFWPPMNANLLPSLFTIAALAAQYTMLGNRFYRGTCKLAKFCPELRPGMTVDLDLSMIAPRPNGKPSVMTAYVDTVNHEINVQTNAAIVGSTTVGFSRGAFDSEVYTSEIGFRTLETGEDIEDLQDDYDIFVDPNDDERGLA